MDFYNSYARNSPTLNKRLYTLYLIFYPFYYSFYTLLISAQERRNRHKNRNQKQNPLSTRDPNISITPTVSTLLIFTLKRFQTSPPTSPHRYRYKRVIFTSSSSPPPPPQPAFNIIITNLSINFFFVDNSTSPGRSPSPTLS